MKNSISVKGIALLLAELLIFNWTVPLYAQDGGAATPEPAPAPAPSPATESNTGSDLGSDEGSSENSIIQNAVIEGIQLSSEAGTEAGEKVVSCYFIFRDKPSSYFYEMRRAEKKLVFEFNDTEKGTSPIQSAGEAPILGFAIDQKRVDVNKDVRGLNPEFHDMVSVAFDLDNIPSITVNDEYSVISFSYKWTTDPSKASKYAVKAGTNWAIIGPTGGLGLVGCGILAWYLLKPEKKTEEGPLSIGDLPVHHSPFP
jgi:hypothetical protein